MRGLLTTTDRRRSHPSLRHNGAGAVLVEYDVIVIGAGVLGASTAMHLAEGNPRLRVAVVEKEPRAAVHQSGRNSGVIHSGIYYKPGSLKAATCVAGARALLEFCERESVPHAVVGKVIVATSEAEIPALEELRRRGEANGVPGVEVIGPERLREIEPHARGVKALHSPRTAIVDFARVTEAYLERARRADAEVIFGARVLGFDEKPEGVELRTTAGDITGGTVVNCAGLHADFIARMMGGGGDTRVVPFRGEYFLLAPEARSLVNGLVYPVPDPRFPFLGAHFTRRLDGGVEAGPNAVLALAREGYGKASLNPGDLAGMLTYPGFWRMSARYWKMGLEELYRSLRKAAFVRGLQALVPETRAEHLKSGGAGVRAQAVDRRGQLVDDFRIEHTPRAVHVRNAPSPAATASLEIGRRIAALAMERSGLATRHAP